MEQPLQFEFIQLYDGTGRHLGGVYPSLLIDNYLTPAYFAEKALRPFRRHLMLNPGDVPAEQVLVGFVWMIPLGTTSAAAMPHALFAEFVQVVDRGYLVVLHGDTQLAVDCIGACIGALVGGGHA